MSYMFSYTFFSLPLIFTLHWWLLTFLLLSTPLPNFHVVLSTKNVSFVSFISNFRSLSPFFSLSFAGLPPTFSFSLSFSIFQICGHDNYSKLNTLDNTHTETISELFRKLTLELKKIEFFDSLVVSALMEVGGYAISCQNNLELHLVFLVCHTCWLNYFTLVYPWCGRTVVRCTVTWLPNFLGFSYPRCSAARFARESSSKKTTEHFAGSLQLARSSPDVSVL